MKQIIKSIIASSLLILAAVSCNKTEPEPEYDDTLTLKGAVLTVDGKGGEVSATLSTNVTYSVKIQDGVDWVTYIPTRTSTTAPEDKTVTFNVQPFPKSTEASRSAVVTISATGLKDQILTIVQTPTAQIYLTVESSAARFSMDGGELTVDIQSSVDYTITVDEGADWITPDPSNPTEGNGLAKFTIAANTVSSEREANITIATEGLEPVVITVHQDAWSSNIGIKSLSDFLEFVEASNVGDYEQHDLSKWVNEEGEICLLCDLDLSGLSSWTPIGQSTDLTLIKNRSALADSVRAFGNHYNSGLGVFNGKNHVISGLKITVGNEGNKNYQGFFGPLYNATVKNLIFDESCSITVDRSYASSDAYGFVTPSAIASTIENVVVKGSINVVKSFTDNSEAYRGFYVGAIAGVLCGNAVGDAVVRNCSFEGKEFSVTVSEWGSTNFKTIGALVGYAVHDIGTGDDRWADPNYAHKTAIIGCTNSSEIDATCQYLGGILGTTYNRISVENCINRGNVFLDSKYGNGRGGGIIGYDQGVTTVDSCENYGNIHSLDTKNTCVGGITSVVAGKCTYTNNKCDNIVSGQYKTIGIFVANVNNASAQFEGNLAKGAVAKAYDKGEYTDKVEVTEENFSTYVGNNGKDAPTFPTGVSFWK